MIGRWVKRAVFGAAAGYAWKQVQRRFLSEEPPRQGARSTRR